jgi:VanZ family protein
MMPADPATEPRPPSDGAAGPLRTWPLLLRWLPAFALMAAIFTASNDVQVVAIMPAFANADKVAHLAAYAVLAALYLFALSPFMRSRPFLMGLLAVILTALYGATDELHQSFVPGRDCSFADWVADVVGGSLAVGSWAIVRKARMIRVPDGGGGAKGA